jgi:hypothetical protein
MSIVTITAEKAHDVLTRAQQGEKFDYLPFQQLSKEGREMRADIEARQLRGEFHRSERWVFLEVDSVSVPLSGFCKKVKLANE